MLEWLSSVAALVHAPVAKLLGQPGLLLALAAAVLAAALVRGFTGFGFMLAAVPLMGLFMAPARAVPVAVGLQVLGGLFDVRRASHSCHWPSIRWLALGALIGSPIGAIVLGAVSPAVARVLISLVALLAVVVLGRGFSLPHLPGRLTTTCVGVAAGLGNGLAGMPGPAAVAYYMSVPMSGVMARASLLVFFFATSLVAAASVIWLGLATLDTLLLSLFALPLMWLGTIAGEHLFQRGGASAHRGISIACLAIIALSSGAKGLSELLM